MDTSRLVMWAMGVVLIGIGVPLFYLARYLLAPESDKMRIAKGIRAIAIVWMAVGLLIYVVDLFLAGIW
jgi:hypothetical protein